MYLVRFAVKRVAFVKRYLLISHRVGRLSRVLAGIIASLEFGVQQMVSQSIWVP